MTSSHKLKKEVERDRERKMVSVNRLKEDTDEKGKPNNTDSRRTKTSEKQDDEKLLKGGDGSV